MWDKLLQEFGGRGMGVVLGMILGTTVTGLIAVWKRRRERRNILHGDARDTVVISLNLVESETVPSPGGTGTAKKAKRLRIRSLGQSQLDQVVPNGHLERELLARAFGVTPRHTLISMEGPEGSYLLETLTNFVCDRVANEPFEHDLYVMAPCCEPAGLVIHQPITILLVKVSDLSLFQEWPLCRDVQVEHGADGIRVLTLMEMAKRFRDEQALLAQRRQAGERTRYLETMYILDLTLDSRTADIPTKPVPWGRFEHVLKPMNLE